MGVCASANDSPARNSENPSAAAAPAALSYDDLDEDSYRRISYDFSVDVLRLPTISTILCFTVGDNEVENFRMIERHYFRDRVRQFFFAISFLMAFACLATLILQLIKSYDFHFGFCIPNSTNTWESIYTIPPLEESLSRLCFVRSYFRNYSHIFQFKKWWIIRMRRARTAFTL